MTFLVTARDETMTEVAPVTGYLDMELELRCMAAGGSVGYGRIDVSNEHPALAHLLTDHGDVIEGTGLVVRRPGGSGPNVVIGSGDIVDAQVDEWPGGRASLMVTWDDSILSDEIAYADPTTDVSSTGLTTLADGHDIRTGPAESVFLEYLAANIGPAAGVARRQYSWLILPTTSGRGGSDTWKARDETLLDLGRRIFINNGLIFSLAQNPDGAGVVVTITEPGTDPVARFSAESGSVTGLKIGIVARTVDEVIVAGPGTDVARVRTRRNTTIAAGRRRRVQLLSEPSPTGSGTQIRDLMRQPADEALKEGEATGAATFSLVEQPGRLYGIDWALGSVISVASWHRTTVTGVVRSVKITHAAGRDPVITPFVGTPSDLGALTSLKAIRRLIHPLLTE